MYSETFISYLHFDLHFTTLGLVNILQITFLKIYRTLSNAEYSVKNGQIIDTSLHQPQVSLI